MRRSPTPRPAGGLTDCWPAGCSAVHLGAALIEAETEEAHGMLCLCDGYAVSVDGHLPVYISSCVLCVDLCSVRGLRRQLPQALSRAREAVSFPRPPSLSLLSLPTSSFSSPPSFSAPRVCGLLGCHCAFPLLSRSARGSVSSITNSIVIEFRQLHSDL